MNVDNRLLDQLADEFEQLWQQGIRPQLEQWLDRVPEEHRTGLADLLIPIDIEYRHVGHESISAERDYGPLGEDIQAIARKCLESGGPAAEGPGIAAVPLDSVQRIQRKPSTGEGMIAGPYRLIRLLGKGGMGEVWLAEQSEPVKRLAALKLIRVDLGSKEVLGRFEAERQALALMNHPNIAQILDAGTTPDGLPYFAMEYVDGQWLTGYCDSKRLGVNERLQLFADVCSGVQHAHQKGILHRDLKPSNILVVEIDGKPVPKIIDFGLAKAMENTQRLTDNTLFTGVGQILGTLRYMSPEQACLDNLDIDTRTDIYSLGVVLYELLTGATPLDSSTVKGQAVLRVLEWIREQEPPRPSSKLGNSTREQLTEITTHRKTDVSRLNRVLSGDLDWIVMKALDKDRNRRYESASGLATDILHYLADEPVSARPPSLHYRVGKLLRKNRFVFVAASLLLLSLFAGLAGTTWQMYRAMQAEKTAEAKRREAEESSLIARAQSQLALSTLRTVINEIGRGLGKLPGTSEVRKNILSLAMENLQGVAKEYVSQSRVDRQTSMALTDLADLIQEFGGSSMEGATGKPPQTDSAVDSAILLYERAMAIMEALSVDEPDNGHLIRDRAVVSVKLGDVLQRTGKTTEALRHYQRAIGWLEELLATRPVDPQIERDYAAACLAMGDILRDVEGIGKSILWYEKSLAIRQRMADENPSDREALRNVSTTRERLGMAFYHSGDLPSASREFQAMSEIKRRISVENPLDPLAAHELGIALTHLGDVQMRSGDSESALQSYESGRAAHQAALDLEPGSRQMTRGLQSVLVPLGDTHKARGALDAAEQCFRDALALGEHLTSIDPGDASARLELAMCLNRIGQLKIEKGKAAEALPLYERSLEVRKELLDSEPENRQFQAGLATSLNRMAEVCLALQKREDSLVWLRQGLEIRERLAREEPENQLLQTALARMFKTLGSVEEQLGNHSSARGAFEKAVQVYETLIKASPDDVEIQDGLSTALWGLGAFHFRMGDYPAAEAVLLRADQIVRKAVETNPDNAMFQNNAYVIRQSLANVFQQTYRYPEARDAYSQALDILVSLQSRGRLGPVEEGYIPRIRERIEICRARILALSGWETIDALSPETRLDVLYDRVTELARQKKIPEAEETLLRWSQLDLVRPEQLYNLACGYGVLLAAMQDSESSPGTDHFQDTAQRALRCLKASVEAGYSDRSRMNADPDLAPLRDMEEFRKLANPPAAVQQDGDNPDG